MKKIEYREIELKDELVRIEKLIALANDSSTSEEERRTAASAACKFMKQEDVFGLLHKAINTCQFMVDSMEEMKKIFRSHRIKVNW